MVCYTISKKLVENNEYFFYGILNRRVSIMIERVILNLFHQKHITMQFINILIISEVKIILAIPLLFSITQISGQSFESMTYPMSAQAIHVKEIKERTGRKWTTYYYHDTTGMLIRQINFYKKQKRADYRFEYCMADSIMLIKEIFDTNYHVMKCHYSPNGQVVKYEIFTNKDLEYPFVLANNFVYEDGLLRSFDWSIAHSDTIFPPQKTKCYYNDKRQLIQKQETDQFTIQGAPPECTTFYRYRYDADGYLTNQVVESTDKESVFTGVYPWSKEQN